MQQENKGRDVPCVLFCVLPCFVLTGNKCILSCTTGASSPLNESNDELIMKHGGVYIFIVLFCVFLLSQDYAIKGEIDLELLPFIFRGST